MKNNTETAVSVNSMTLFWCSEERCAWCFESTSRTCTFSFCLRNSSIWFAKEFDMCKENLYTCAPFDSFELARFSLTIHLAWWACVHATCVCVCVCDREICMRACVCMWVNWILRSQSHSIVFSSGCYCCCCYCLLLLLLYIFRLSWLQTSECTREERERPFRVSQTHVCMKRRIESRECVSIRYSFSLMKRGKCTTPGANEWEKGTKNESGKRTHKHTENSDVKIWKVRKTEKLSHIILVTSLSTRSSKKRKSAIPPYTHTAAVVFIDQKVELIDWKNRELTIKLLKVRHFLFFD